MSRGSGIRGEGRGAREEGCQEFSEMVEEDPDYPLGRAPFDLARKLRTITDRNPEQFEGEIFARCEASAELAFEEVWYGFLEVFERMRLPEGYDTFALAAEAAVRGGKPCLELTRSLGFH
jgi:hypothetical protein